MLTEPINVTSLDALAEYGVAKTVIAIGVFDGVHTGHQKLITKLLEMADKEDAEPVIFTFFPHPREILQPSSPPALLLPQAKKGELLNRDGVKAVVTIPFSASFASLAPEEFIRECLFASRIDMKGICVGRNWRFGVNGSGDISILKKFADDGHFSFEAVDEFLLNGEPVSSTAIRRAISSGLLERAEAMLGRPYSICGKVQTGRGVATSLLASPTANLDIECGIVPPDGVYAGIAHWDAKEYIAAIAIGTSPTFCHHEQENHQRRVEVHMLDFKGDIYGEIIEVDFIGYIREERCYSTADALKKQIKNDVIEIKKLLKERA